MPLKRGYSNRTINENIRREIHAGREPRQAVAISYSMARDAALKAGNIERYRQLLPKGDDFTQLLLVGGWIGALPSDIQAMNEDEAFFELQRLDALQAQRRLTPEEHQRLVDVEKRLEQFVPTEQLKKAKEAEEKAARGELDIPEATVRPGEQVIELPEMVIRAPSPAEVFIPIETGPMVAKKKAGTMLGFGLLAALTYAVINKKSMFG